MSTLTGKAFTAIDSFLVNDIIDKYNALTSGLERSVQYRDLIDRIDFNFKYYGGRYYWPADSDNEYFELEDMISYTGVETLLYSGIITPDIYRDILEWNETFRPYLELEENESLDFNLPQACADIITEDKETWDIFSRNIQPFFRISDIEKLNNFLWS